MRLSDAFDRGIVVPDGLALLDAAGIDELCRGRQGLLLVTPDMSGTIHRHCDQLVEQADARNWSALYLAHELEVGEEPHDGPELVRCAIPPTSVTVLAIRPGLLRVVLSSMPTGAQARGLRPVDWLTMASWMLLDYAPLGTVWGAYPGLQPAGAPLATLH